MDLKEEDILGADIGRHWYYRAKAAALRRAVGGLLPTRILDVGAGSGFFSRHLLANGARSALCVDVGYPGSRDEMVGGKPMLFRRDCSETDCDLVLMMDVLEHVENDVELVRHYTTTDMTPDQVHELGQQEVKRIRAEMEALIKETGFTGSFAEFQTMLRTDPRFYVTTRQALLEKASEIAKRVDDQLPRHFGRLPRLPYGVRPVPAEIEENYTTGRYFEGSPSQGIAGGLMINTSHLDQRPLYELPALALHEGVPGHHLQIALSQELTDVPAFRRNAYVTAFVEGWGLYSEQLGDEMGIYRDNYERFGKLSYEMWRACRLVADTGIHWKGWSVEQARACFTDNTALSPTNIQNELMRYVSWPGQALAYKIGELKIMELRHRAEKALGDKFDERAFHDRVLLAGPLPLDILESRVNEWIAAQQKP